MYEHQKVSHFPSLQYFSFLVTNHTSLKKNADIKTHDSLSYSITFVLHSGEVQYSSIKFLVAPMVTCGQYYRHTSGNVIAEFSIFLTYQWIQSEVQHCDGGVKF